MKILKWSLCILTVLATIVALFVLPDSVPVHFDISGTPDRWGSKYELLILPVVLIGCAYIIDPIAKSYLKKAEDTENEKEKAELLSNAKVLNITSIVTMFLFFFMNIITLYNTYMLVTPNSNLPEFDMGRGVGVIMGITIVILVNYMPKTRNNKTIGFRLPWTMYNDVTWHKSNKFSSYVLMIVGAIAALSSLLVEGEVGVIISSVAMILGISICIIYAYIVYRNEKRKDNERNN